MVKLDKIYTRGGDQGKTSLVDGSRTAKNALVINAVGTVEEAGASIGLARMYTSGRADKMLAHILNDLFDLGADLATPGMDFAPSAMSLRITNSQTKRLEEEIDIINDDLSPLESFILPGGSPASSHLHLARTIVRRAERAAVSLNNETPVNPEVIRYLNRLSDHLFVLARSLNDKGQSDVLWVPGENRQ